MGDGCGGCVLWKLWNLRVCLYLTICIRKFVSAITTYIFRGHMWPSQPLPQAINSHKSSWEWFITVHQKTLPDQRIIKKWEKSLSYDMFWATWKGRVLERTGQTFAFMLESWELPSKMHVWSQGNAPTPNAVSTMILFGKDVCCLHLAVNTILIIDLSPPPCAYRFVLVEVRKRCEASPSISLHPFPWDNLSHQTWS